MDTDNIQQPQAEEERRRQEEQDAINAYADAMIRRDKNRWYVQPGNCTQPGELSTDGRALIYSDPYETERK